MTLAEEIYDDSKGGTISSLSYHKKTFKFQVQSVKYIHQYFHFFSEKSRQYRDFKAGTGLK